MPTYRYSAPNDLERHEVIADSYQRDGDVIVFDGIASVDGDTSFPGGTLRTGITGDLEVVET